MSRGITNTLTDLAEEIAAGSFRNEAEISQGVVKRVLHEMGWPVFDIRIVAPEFKIGVRKVDYALCHPPGKPAMLVEVKDLGKADEKGEMQLFEYCFHQGVPIAILTDGRTWSFFFPAGQGSYEERRFAQINLVHDSEARCADTLTAYLAFEDVKSGKARKRAERDYDIARDQKEAASEYTSVWRKLLAGPEPLLIDLFSEEVENVTGVRPDRDLAAAFIRGQGRIKKSSSDRPRRSPARVRKPVHKVATVDSERIFALTLHGNSETFSSGVEVMVAVFGKLAAMDSDFCRRYAETHRGRLREYVAKSRDALYPGHHAPKNYAAELPNGWWLATHCSNSDKLKRIRQACQVARIEFGKDLIVQIPVGSRKDSAR